MKKEITTEEYLQIVGLMSLVKKHSKWLNRIHGAMGKILDEYDHVSDAIYDHEDIDLLLKKLGIEKPRCSSPGLL